MSLILRPGKLWFMTWFEETYTNKWTIFRDCEMIWLYKPDYLAYDSGFGGVSILGPKFAS